MSIVPQSGEGLGSYLRRVLGNMVTSVRTSGNIQARIDGNTLSISVPNQVSNRPFFAKITASAGITHTWVEQWQVDSTTFEDLPNGRTGDGATEINGRQGVPGGTIVIMYSTRPSDNGVPVYQFDLGAGSLVDEDGLPANPYDLDPADPDSETADTKTWDIDAQGDDRGFTMSVVTRVVYDAAGDNILYRFVRVMTFDANGHCVSVGVETRETVDVPDEDCLP